MKKSTDLGYVDPRHGRQYRLRRRGSGEGSIRWVARKKRFEARISVMVDGKRKQISRYFETERQAYDGLSAMRGQHLVKSAKRDAVNFGWFLTGWLEGKRDSTATATFKLYESTARKYLQPSLGHHDLEELDPLAIDAFMVSLRAKTTPTRRRAILAILTRVLNAAVRNDPIAKNPAIGVDKPKVAQGEAHPLEGGSSASPRDGETNDAGVLSAFRARAEHRNAPRLNLRVTLGRR